MEETILNTFKSSKKLNNFRITCKIILKTSTLHLRLRRVRIKPKRIGLFERLFGQIKGGPVHVRLLPVRLAPPIIPGTYRGSLYSELDIHFRQTLYNLKTRWLNLFPAMEGILHKCLSPLPLELFFSTRKYSIQNFERNIRKLDKTIPKVRFWNIVLK